MPCASHLLRLRSKSFAASVFALAGLCLLLFTPRISAQTAPGLQAPEKRTSGSDASSQVKAARGETPLVRKYDYLKADPSKIKRLAALSASEMPKVSTDKIPRIGVVRSLDRLFNPLSNGKLYRVVEGDVRVMEVVSEKALYTRVHFRGMSLPVGARVFVYSLKNADEFYGPYEGRGPSEDGTFWTPPMAGEGVVIEYFTPSGQAEGARTPFKVSDISHIFTDVASPEAGSCNVEVPAQWANLAKSVGLLDFITGNNEALCTGTLLNDQASDQIPYLLTANHCISTQAEAQSLRVYWNYNSGDSPPPLTPFTDGASLLVTGTRSDFTFVRLTGALPGGLFFSGWNASAVPVATSVTGIHHPDGSHKRISFGTTNANCTPGLPLPFLCSDFTHVGWSSGVTEPGSSGSGLWTGPADNPQLVGTLTGGTDSCSNPTGNVEYGSFSVSYPNIASFLAGSDCVTALNPTSQNFPAGFPGGSGPGSVNVTAPNGCSWSASSTAGFVTITSGASGSGNGTVNFTVADNDGPKRSASIVVGQKVMNITQDPGGGCVPRPILVGQTVNTSLSTGSCPLGDGTYYDPYTFDGLAGQQVSILMTASYDTYLFLLRPDGSVLAEDDDGGGGSNARIPAGGGLLTLPATGTYTILANTFNPNQTGQYSLTLNGAPLSDLSVSQSVAHDRVAPGSRVIYLVTVTNNAGTLANSITVTDNLPATVTFVSCGAADGSCGGTGNNRTATFSSLAVGASAMAVMIATVNNSNAPDTVISNTTTVSTSGPDPNANNDSATATFTVKASPFISRANGRIAFGSDRNFSNSTQPSGIYAINSDGAGESYFANIPLYAAAFAWSPDGSRIAYRKGLAGSLYGDEIRVANPDGSSAVKVAGSVFERNSRIAWAPNGTKLAFIGLNSFIYTVNADGTGLAKIPNSPQFVNDLSWSPDGAMFAYSDENNVFVMNADGSAQANLTLGRVSISGEPARSILPHWSPDGTRLVFEAQSNNYRRLFMMKPDGSALAAPFDLYAQQPAWSPDGSQLAFISLNSLYVSNPDGTGLTQVTNNGFYNAMPEWQPLANALDQPSFFVRQHYLDFLNREPDPAGLAYWTGQITPCGVDLACVRGKRLDVSNAFFFELEYQQTGAYVYRLYRAAYGNNQPAPNADGSNPTEAHKLPAYAVFAPDRAQVVGGANLAQGQLTFANTFVQRSEFLAKYPASLDGPAFVDAVLATIQNDFGVDLTSQRAGLIALFNSGGRAAVMYRLADDNPQTNPINNRAFIDAEYNRAFVFTEYAGYLRRDSDIGGFLFWLAQVNSGPLRDTAKQHAMVCSFVTSGEYQLRFSSFVTHRNSECPQ